VTLPVGCLVGGITMAFTTTPIPFMELLINTLPVIALSLIVCLGLLWKQNLMVKIFSAFGKGVSFIAVTSLGLAAFQYISDIRLPLFYLMVEENEALGMIPLEFAIWLIGIIAIVLAGAFPMILFLNRRLEKLMNKFGKHAGIGSEASTGLLTQLASSIPVWSIVADMDKRGKLLNVAFAVSGSFVLGDVLAFTGTVNPEMVFPVIAANFSGGILAILLAVILLKRNVVKL
jgi:ethanolamine transporter